MRSRALGPRLSDMIEAIEVIRTQTIGVPLDAFEADRNKRWLIERALEILSEASRHLPAELKARHPHIPWRQIAGIGNILRHDYEHVAADVLWNVAHEHLPELEIVCRDELEKARPIDGDGHQA